jgi:two-component sensor histidine kinase
VVVEREKDHLSVKVTDNGVGVPAGFDLESSPSLGLQIVRALVVSELGGKLSIGPRPGGGTTAEVDLPLRPGS